jgi:hypothetical protein
MKFDPKCINSFWCLFDFIVYRELVFVAITRIVYASFPDNMSDKLQYLVENCNLAGKRPTVISSSDTNYS